MFIPAQGGGLTRWTFVVGVYLVLCGMAAGAQAQQRTVAVVYDDSGSMDSEDRWSYANYAIQTLTGLLGPDDRLLVVKMSDPTRFETVDLRNQTRSMADLRARYTPTGNTPYLAVQTAISQLAQAPGEDKWMLIISDGAFEDFEAAQEVGQIRLFREETGARVSFLLIGQEADDHAADVWNSEAQANLHRAANAQDIIQEIQAIAAGITSRARSGTGPTVQVQGTRIIVSSEFPLRRLTVLEQDPAPSAALSTLQAASATGAALQTVGPLTMSMPDGSSTPLFGRITHVRHPADDQVIPAGAVTLTFDRALREDRLRVLPEVAARLEVSAFDLQGQPIPLTQNTFAPCIGDTMLVHATLLAPDGSFLLPTLRRPNLLQATVQLNQQAQTMTLRPLTRDAFEHALVASDEAATFSVSAAYPGYFDFTSKVYTIRGEDCIPPRDLAVEPIVTWMGLVNEFSDKPPLVITPTANGSRITPDEFERWDLDVVRDAEIDVRIRKDDQGWSARPAHPWLLAAFTPIGAFEVEVEISSRNPKETPTRATLLFVVEKAPFWVLWGTVLIVLLILLVLATWIIGVLKKRRFSRGSRIIFTKYLGDRRIGKPRPRSLPGSWFSRWVVPFKAEQRTVEGITFVAGSRGSFIYLPRKVQHEDMRIAGFRLETPKRKDQPIRTGDVLEIDKGRHTLKYEYLTS